MKYARGIDVSRWQGSIDWFDPDLHDVEFVYVKLADGIKRAKNGAQHMDYAHGACFLTGPYHLWQPPDKCSGQAQARNMLARLPRWYGRGCLPPALDIETCMIDRLPSAEEDVFSMIQWAHAMRNQLRVRPVLYISPRGIRHLERESAGIATKLPAHFDLWCCDYDRLDGVLPRAGETPGPIAPWDCWRFWQYTSSLDGGLHGMESSRLDGNLFNGTMHTLYHWYESCWDWKD